MIEARRDKGAAKEWYPRGNRYRGYTEAAMREPPLTRSGMGLEC